jgi:hypothetical protein
MAGSDSGEKPIATTTRKGDDPWRRLASTNPRSNPDFRSIRLLCNPALLQRSIHRTHTRDRAEPSIMLRIRKRSALCRVSRRSMSRQRRSYGAEEELTRLAESTRGVAQDVRSAPSASPVATDRSQRYREEAQPAVHSTAELAKNVLGDIRMIRHVQLS